MNNLFSRLTLGLPPPSPPPPNPTLSSLDPSTALSLTQGCSHFAKSISHIVVLARDSSPYADPLLLLLSPTSQHTATLLTYSSHPSFPNLTQPLDLLPNLIHGLRLLRVLSQIPNPPPLADPLATLSSLASPLLTSLSIGELLRPHLPSLFALMSAPYTLPGIPIPQTLVPLLHKFANNCLTKQLCFFIHDRSCIPNMLLDIADLLEEEEEDGTDAGGSEGNESTATPPASSGLITGPTASHHSLPLLALTTIVDLLIASAAFPAPNPLLTQFSTNGGYDITEQVILSNNNDRAPSIDILARLITIDDKPSQSPSSVDEGEAKNDAQAANGKNA